MALTNASSVVSQERFGAAVLPFVLTGRVTRTVTTAIFSRGRGGWSLIVNRTRIDYRHEVGDPATNSAVGAVVGWISRNFPEAPVRVVRENDPNREPIARSRTGPGGMLRLLEKPNAWYSGVLQWMATVVDYVTDGNAYWIKVRNDSDRVIELWWVPQRMMKPLWPLDDPTVFISDYEITIDGIPYIVETRNVVHFRNGIDPENVRKGKAPLKSLLREIYTDEEAGNFTASLLKNLGVPGVVIAPSNTGGRALQTDPEGVKKSFMDKFGGDKRGEPLVLTAPTDVKVLSFNPQQMELRELRRIPEERISAVLGVPAGVAGLGAGLDRNTFTNYSEANKAAYTQAVIPLHRLMAAELEVQLLPDFAGDPEILDVIFDVTVVAAMQEAAGEVDKRAQLAAQKGLITRADYKRAVGRRPAEDGSDDIYLVPNNYLILDAGKATAPKILIGDTPTPPALGPGGAVALLAEPVEVRCQNVRPTGKVCGRRLAVGVPPITGYCSHCNVETAVEAVVVEAA